MAAVCSCSCHVKWSIFTQGSRDGVMWKELEVEVTSLGQLGVTQFSET